MTNKKINSLVEEVGVGVEHRTSLFTVAETNGKFAACVRTYCNGDHKQSNMMHNLVRWTYRLHIYNVYVHNGNCFPLTI